LSTFILPEMTGSALSAYRPRRMNTCHGGEQEADSTVSNALSMSQMYSLAKNEAVKEAQAVAKAIDGWKQHFKACGVTRGDIDLYAEQIDRPFLRDQRSEISLGRS